MLIDQNRVKQDITDLLAVLVPKIVLDPDFKFRIRETSIVQDYSLGFDRWYNLIKVQIETNNRPLFLGQFLNIPTGSLRGLFSFYYSGLVDGFLRAKYGEAITNLYALALDVYETGNDQPLRMTRYIQLEDAIHQGIITAQSRLATKMKEHNLDFLLLVGASISGPSLDMIDFVTELVSRQKFCSVLDLFSGTGSYAKICLQKGCEYVVAVDTYPDVIEKNIGPQSRCLEIKQADAFNFLPDRKFDLAIIDPFYDDALIAAKNIIPKLINKVSLIMLDVGRTYDTFWVSKVSRVFQEIVTQTKVLTGYYSIALLGDTRK